MNPNFKRSMITPELYEGGIFSGGAHTRGKHFQSDCEKYNTAGLMGWRVFRLHCDMVYKDRREMPDAVDLIKQVLEEGELR